MPEFDVIIVGGRPAGATLAARLGQMNLRVLLLERAVLPSLPAASSPIIYAPAMRLLDEIGADESAYAWATPRITRMVNAGDMLPFAIRIPQAYGRDYAYAIDRARFDAALWDAAVRHPTVTGIQNIGVTGLLWQDGQVVGVEALNPERERVTYRARLVVGADGRFSTVARLAGAAAHDEQTAHPTTLYYAYWRGVTPYDAQGAVAMTYGEGDGLGFLLMDSADETTVVVIEGQAERLSAPAGRTADFYTELLRRYPTVWARLRDAERVTDVHGMKRVGNLYRQPGGAGWALVGDAYHQKDPIDGQGIYDALYTAKALASAIAAWQNGTDWDAALALYDRTARAETYPVYRATLNRVKGSVYNEMPDDMPVWMAPIMTNPTLMRLMTQTVFRWAMQDPLMQERLGKALVRSDAPLTNDLMTSPLFMGAVLRGPLRDLSARLDQLDRELERLKHS